MATRSRDLQHYGSTRSERNKENISAIPSPSPSPVVPHRLRPNYIPTLTKTPDHKEFFTDSFIDNTSHSSLSASPLPASRSSLPRLRASGSARGYQRPQHRSTRSDLLGTPGKEVKHHYPKPLARGTSPIRSDRPATPPRSRQSSFSIGSPSEHVASSPPTALTENYSRIAQEEDLAATEGEISDPDSPVLQNRESVRVNGHITPKAPSVESLHNVSRTRGRLAVDEQPPARNYVRPAENLTTTTVWSDPGEKVSQRSGMSFIDQVTDPKLRLVMTPHFESKLEDQRALHRVWAEKKPIAFPKAQNVLLEPDAVAKAVSDTPQVLPPRVKAFTKAGRIALASDNQVPHSHHRTLSDDATTTGARLTGLPPLSEQDRQTWRDVLPPNPRVHRQPYFAKNHGFPERINLEFDAHNQEASKTKAQSESPQISVPNMLDGAFRQSLRSLNSRKSLLHPAVKSVEDLTGGSNAASDASSDIWAQQKYTQQKARSESQSSDTQELHLSPEKSRKMDFDFTGQSFQVSESPPVRAKSMAQDYSKTREIQGLARQAVTTSRLSQLRARESLERIRQASRSPVSDNGSYEGGDLQATPAVSGHIYRTISNGSARSKPTESPSGHDILQRLARSSSTPRSSTPSEKTINGEILSDKQPRSHKLSEEASIPRTQNTDLVSQLHGSSTGQLAAATPKVTGAWTDTILPDTVRTAKQTKSKALYAQTPHVSAGGWVETPAQNGRLEPLLEDSQEVPEELLTGIGKDSASDRTIMAGNDNDYARTTIPQDSIARRLLDEARTKQTQDQVDDSLLLGNTTIQSLENVLDQDETDMTIRSQLPQTDTEVLDRLGTKLDRLRTHIHDARQGISKLEHQIVTETPTTATLIGSNEEPSSFPFALLTVRLPIPMLFRQRSDRWLPELTPFGWCVLTFFSWYVLENLFAELFAHPLYASSYTWPDRPEPEFPFVLPTMLLRWCRMEFVTPLIFTPLKSILMAFLRMVGILFGWTDAHIGSSVGVQGQNGTAVENGMASENFGFDMMNDEVL